MLEWIPLIKAHQMPTTCGIYIIRHVESGKEYVGKSVNIRRRLVEHRKPVGDDTVLRRALKKHGFGAFVVCVYAHGTDAEMLRLEVQVIAERKTFGPGGYNRTSGGEGVSGRKMTEAQRKAHGDRFRGKTLPSDVRARIRESVLLSAADRRGVPRSTETRAKMSAAARLRAPRRPGIGSMSEEAKQKLREAALGRDLGENNPRARPVLVWQPGSFTPLRFGCGKAAADYFGFKKRSVNRWAEGTYTPSNGYVFAYE